MATVGVVVTTYHQAGFLGRALQSLMQQGVIPDVVVVDDGSSDRAESEAIVAAWPGVRYLWQPNAGVAAARNAGLKQLSTDFVVFLDADDRMLPGALAHGVEALEAAPEAAWSSSRSRRVWADGTEVAGAPPNAPSITEDHYRRLLLDPWICPPSTTLFRREVLLAAGGWCEDRELAGADDYELYLRILRDHVIVDADVVTVDYVQHEGNTGRDAGRLLGGILEALERQREFTQGSLELEQVRLDSMASFRRGLGLRASAQRLQCAVRESRRDLLPAIANFIQAARHSPKLLAAMARAHFHAARAGRA